LLSAPPPTRVNLNYVAASSKLAFIGETSLAVLPNYFDLKKSAR
jgi:hypothetical protein